MSIQLCVILWRLVTFAVIHLLWFDSQLTWINGKLKEAGLSWFFSGKRNRIIYCDLLGRNVFHLLALINIFSLCIRAGWFKCCRCWVGWAVGGGQTLWTLTQVTSVCSLHFVFQPVWLRATPDCTCHIHPLIYVIHVFFHTRSGT